MQLMKQSPQQLLRATHIRDLKSFITAVSISTAIPALIAYYGCEILGLEGARPWLIAVFAWACTVACITAVYSHRHYKKLESSLMPIASRATLGDQAATIIHDIRSPLTSLRTAIRYLSSNTSDAEHWNECWSLLQRSSERIESIGQGFLDDLERRHSKLKSVNVDHVCQNLVEEYRMRPDLTEMEFIFRNNASQNAFVSGIPTHIERCIANIVGNAIEAMKKVGMITVTTASHENDVFVAITDTGCGMTQEQVDSILAAQGHTQGKADGHGIGLQFVLQTIEQHEGTLAIDSTLGEGATFTIRFPRAQAETGKVLQFKRAENS